MTATAVGIDLDKGGGDLGDYAPAFTPTDPATVRPTPGVTGEDGRLVGGAQLAPWR